MKKMIEITLPNLDENVTEYTIGRWLKSVGDQIKASEPILEVETDKVTMEISAEVDGTLTEILVTTGDVLQPGTNLAFVSPINHKVPVETTAVSPTKTQKETRLTPVVARMVQEHNLDVTTIQGTGKNGRVTKKDILTYLKNPPSATPTEHLQKPADPAPIPAQQPIKPTGSKLPLSGMRRSIAEHMVRSLQTSPHVTTLFEFDFSAVRAHRKKHKDSFARDGIKLTYMAYLALATVEALRTYPIVNSVFHDDGIELKAAINLGIITAVPDGLFAPVIHHADDYNLRGIARMIGELAAKARDGKLNAADLKDGTFTISNHGAAGSLAGTPIIYQPQAGILGVGKIEERVKVIDGGIHIRPCAYISFSFDHRIMDGAIADGFVSDIKERIETWRD